MNHYRSYMSRVTLSQEAHKRLMEGLADRSPRRHWGRGLLAACCALVLLVAGGAALLWNTWEVPLLAVTPQVSAAGEALPPTTSPTATDLEQSHTVVVADPFEGQPHGFFDVEGITCTDCTDAAAVSAKRLAPPAGWFQEPMTAQQIITALGGEEEVPWTLLWAGFGLDGTVWYDGQGEVWQAVISGVNGENTLTLTLAPGEIPLTDCFYPDAATEDYRGLEVTAYFLEREEEGRTVYEYHADFLCGETGASFTFTSPDQDTASWLTNVLVWYAAGETPFTTAHLEPTEIPTWRSESITLEEARAEDLGAYLPQTPAGFGFESAWRELGQNRDWLRVSWRRWMDNCTVFVRRQPEAPECMDPEQKERYDINLYSIPWAESVPDEIMFGGFQNPVFRAEDLTEEIVAARARWEDQDAGDTDGWRYSQFGVWYGQAGILVEYHPRGIDPADLYALIAQVGANL